MVPRMRARSRWLRCDTRSRHGVLQRSAGLHVERPNLEPAADAPTTSTRPTWIFQRSQLKRPFAPAPTPGSSSRQRSASIYSGPSSPTTTTYRRHQSGRVPQRLERLGDRHDLLVVQRFANHRCRYRVLGRWVHVLRRFERLLGRLLHRGHRRARVRPRTRARPLRHLTGATMYPSVSSCNRGTGRWMRTTSPALALYPRLLLSAPTGLRIVP